MQLHPHSPPQAVGVHRDLRRWPRVPYSVPIQVHRVVAGIIRSCHGISLDISEGGVGALVSAGPDVGEQVQIEMKLREHLLCIGAIVRHASDLRAGFEFLGLSPEDKLRIARTVGNT